MYPIVLGIHSWLCWPALVAVVGTTLAALRGQVQGDNSVADRWGLFAMMALDLQMLLGLVLYLAVSPNMQPILDNFGAAMKDPALRFWAVEHLSSMLGAVILAHAGRVLARKAKTADAKRTRLLVCFGLATFLVLLGMPWPGRPGGRPLFRGLSARGASLAAFDGRCIRAGCVAPPSNTPGIATPPRRPGAAGAPVLGCRALPVRRLARLSATPDLRHGLL